MTNERKSPKVDLKRNYPVLLEAGLIIALLIMIFAVKVDLESEAAEPPPLDEQEVVEMEEVIQTKQVETPPPPPRPPVPVEVPNDEVIEDELIDMDAELDLEGPMDVPPPPEPADEEEDFFVVVEEMPKPVGGIAAIQNNVEYPEMARKAGIEGRVTVQFIVTKDGEVKNPKVIRGIGGGCDEAAIEAIRKTDFKPGKQRGRPVPVQFALSVNFRLQN